MSTTPGQTPEPRHGVHSDDRAQTTFWLPAGLKAKLIQHAADTGTTMTAIVVMALETELGRAATPAG